MNDFFQKCRFCGKDYSSSWREPNTAKHILLVHEIACDQANVFDQCDTLPPQDAGSETKRIASLEMYDEYKNDPGGIHHGNES